MTDKITNIEELYELINPEFLTTKESCLNMISLAENNKTLLENYIIKVIKKLAKLEDKKVFTQESTYTVKCIDFYTAKNSDDIKSCSESLYSDVLDYCDSIDFFDYEELEE